MSKVTTSSQQLGELIQTAKRTGEKRQQLTAQSIQQNLTSATNSFNTVVEGMVGKLQEYPQPPGTATPQYGLSESGELNIHGDKAQLIRSSPQQQRQQQSLMVSTDATYLEERAGMMEGLENDITQLRDIMVDISQMVVSQGDQINTIEQHTEQAAVDVEVAEKELVRAVKLKKCSRKLTLCICCIVGTIVTIILIIIIAVAVTLSNHK